MNVFENYIQFYRSLDRFFIVPHGRAVFHDSEPSEVVYRTVSRRMGAEPQKIEMIFDLCGVHMRSVCYSYLIHYECRQVTMEEGHLDLLVVIIVLGRRLWRGFRRGFRPPTAGGGFRPPTAGGGFRPPTAGATLYRPKGASPRRKT